MKRSAAATRDAVHRLRSHAPRKCRASKVRFVSVALLASGLFSFGIAVQGQATEPPAGETVVRRAAPGVALISGYMHGNEETAFAEASGFFLGEEHFLVSVLNVFTKQNTRELCDEFVAHLLDGRRIQVKMFAADAILNLITFKVDTPEELPVPGPDFMNALAPGAAVLALAGTKKKGSPHYEVGEIKAADKTSIYGAGLADMFIHSRMTPQAQFFGGPLLTTDGEVIGVNSTNIHLAAPAAPDAQDMHTLPMLVVRGFVRVSKLYPTSKENWLGLAFRPLSQDAKGEIQRAFGQQGGIIVDYVWARGPAAEADVLAGDILFSLNQKPIASVNQLSRVLWSLPPGQAVELALLRDGKLLLRTLQVGKRPAWAGDVIAQAPRSPPANPASAPASQ